MNGTRNVSDHDDLKEFETELAAIFVEKLSDPLESLDQTMDELDGYTGIDEEK